MLVDTHCHIHEPNYSVDQVDALRRAREAGVGKMICVGTDVASSRQACEFAMHHDGVWATIGVHPHEAVTMQNGDWQPIFDELLRTSVAKLVAVGEIGLDYFYGHSPRQVQINALEAQLQLALDHALPVSFHVRDTEKADEGSVWQDFWPIFDNFSGLRGVLHSFTDTHANMEQALTRGLYIGVNGISTFTKDSAQQAMFDAIPLERLLLETDAPFLTPTPLRGKVNEPAYVQLVANYHASRRNMTTDQLGAATSANAHALFAI